MTAAEAMSLGQQHQSAGNLPEAEAMYRRALEADPNELNAKYRLAVVLQLQNKSAEAIELYQQLLHTKPDAAKVHNNLGLAYAGLGRTDDALTHYQEAIRVKPDFAEAFNNRGNLHAALGDSELAVTDYRQALAIQPRYPAALANLGRACATLGRWDDAADAVHQALALQPKSGILWNNLGNARLSQGRFAEAGDCYQQAIRVNPGDAEAHYNVARLHAMHRRWNDAVASLQTSLYHRSDSAKANRMLGDIYYCELGRYAEALQCYQRVASMPVDDERARLLAGALGGSSDFTRVPTEYVEAIYDPLAERFDQYVGKRGDESPHLLRAALEPAPASPTLDILDLGCGTGLCGQQFRSWAKTLVGVDLSANMLGKAQARGVYDELVHADILVPLLERPGRFDLILASDVLLYLGDLAPLFKAVHGALTPGGRFAFTIDLWEGADYHLTPWAHFAHSRLYLERVIQAAGLDEVVVRPVLFPRDGGNIAAGMVMVVRRPQGL